MVMIIMGSFDGYDPPRFTTHKLSSAFQWFGPPPREKNLDEIRMDIRNMILKHHGAGFKYLTIVENRYRGN